MSKFWRKNSKSTTKSPSLSHNSHKHSILKNPSSTSMMSSTSANTNPTRNSIRLSGPVSSRMSLISRKERHLGPSLILKWLSNYSSIVLKTMICLLFTTTRKNLDKSQFNKMNPKRNLNLYLNHQFSKRKRNLKNHQVQLFHLPKVHKSQNKG